MKKVMTLVVLFLAGMTTQTFSQKHHVDYKRGKIHRYYKSQEIRFVENAVLYSVATDGTFQFRMLNRPYQYSYGRRDFYPGNYNSIPGTVIYTNDRRARYYSGIRTDRYGRIISVRGTQIRYKPNGKVKFIGCVEMKYHRGRLRQVGNMHIGFDRYGNLKTYGYVNRYNKRNWHDDWYSYNNDWDNDDPWYDDRDNNLDRIRKKK